MLRQLSVRLGLVWAAVTVTKINPSLCLTLVPSNLLDPSRVVESEAQAELAVIAESVGLGVHLYKI